VGDLTAFVVLWALGWLLLWRVPTPDGALAAGGRPAVSVVVPARDEASNLGALLASLVPQLRAGDELVVVDDHSSDATAAVAAAGGARVVEAPPLPEGWAGKQWACHTGALLAGTGVLVLLDADTRLEPGGLDRIAALGDRPGLTSLQPYHLVPRAAERLAALFNVVAMMGTGAFTVAGRRVAPRAAFGPCLATPVADYRAVGGHAAGRASVLDDVALAAAYRAGGLPVRVLGGRGTIAFRMYPSGLSQLVDGFTKNLASAAGAIPPALTLAVSGWLAACAAPAVLATRVPAVVAVACYLAVALQLHAHLRRLGSFGPVVALAYPVALAVFVAVCARSLVLTAGRGRVTWKGRSLRTRG
jgi:4,4'-diaponeurosporenoate glycosyltransferase